MKKVIVFFAAIGVFIAGCSCPARQKEAAVAPAPAKKVVISPCEAQSMEKAMRSYPAGDIGGNAIRLEKLAPAEVVSNQSFDYQIKVTNLTDMTLSNVVVKDCVPENLKVKSSSPRADMRESNAYWKLGTLGPGGSTIISVTAVAEGKGSILSCTDVSYESPTCAKINIVEPKLELAKFAPSESLKCDRIPLRYVVRNTGTGFACDIEVRDSLPAGLVTSEGNGEIMFRLASLGPGMSHEFKKMADATKTGTFESKAVATSRTSGKVESSLVTTIVHQPVLAINGSCPKEQYLGRSVTYEITITNKGDAAAKSTVIQATVPEGIEFSSATDGGSFSHASPGRVVWNIGDLAANGSRTVSMTLNCNMAGSMATQAKVEAQCAQSASTSCQTMLAGIPAILLEVVDVSDPIEIGRTATYFITVTNQGSAADTNIRISCMLDEGMQYASSSGPTTASIEQNKIVFGSLSSLAPKAQARWILNVKALNPGDLRFKVMMTSEQLTRPVEETEATRFYK